MDKPYPAVPFEPTHDIYHYTGNPLDKFFTPKSVALIGATEKHRQRGPHDFVEFDQQPLRRHRLPDQSQPPQRAGHQGLSQYRRRARESRSGRHSAPPRPAFRA